MSQGLFVVFEGIDGSGTTTQAARWADHLRAQGRRVHVTREPSTGPIGVQIRQFLALPASGTLPSFSQPDVMALLFAADRLDHVASEIEPHLRDGDIVLSDRYDLSSLTYQAIASTGPGGLRRLHWIRELNRFALRPDVTVVLDVSPEVAAARRRARGGAAELFDDEGFQARLAAAYLRAEELVPGDRLIHLDGDRSPDEVFNAIDAALWTIVQKVEERTS